MARNIKPEAKMSRTETNDSAIDHAHSNSVDPDWSSYAHAFERQKMADSIWIERAVKETQNC